MATALDYISGDQAITKARKLGLTLNIVSGTWELSKDGRPLHRSQDTDSIRQYMTGYEDGLIERCANLNLDVAYEEGVWKIKRNLDLIWASEDTDRTADFIYGIECGYKTAKIQQHPQTEEAQRTRDR